MNLTAKELKVLEAFTVSNYGEYDDVLWMWEISDTADITGKAFSGVCSSLIEKDLIVTDTTGDKGMLGIAIEDTYTIALTEKGKEVVKNHFNV